MLNKQTIHPPGNIWAFINNGNVALGYWPKELFTNLGNGADTVFWGGMVYSNLPNSPPMGSGLFKNGNYGNTCYMKQMSVRTVPGAPFVTADDALVLYKNSRCYNVAGYENVGRLGLPIPLWGKKAGIMITVDMDNCRL
uniref:Neprosin PEP catalytic domain-containing protein n=1 Tax=Fagus sylvatica TaxID=28930 RepID=A0A2N9GBP7_FAGSY